MLYCTCGDPSRLLSDYVPVFMHICCAISHVHKYVTLHIVCDCNMAVHHPAVLCSNYCLVYAVPCMTCQIPVLMHVCML